jgi:PEP-CTERM motif
VDDIQLTGVALASTQTVPEPTSLALLCVSLAVGAGRIRRSAFIFSPLPSKTRVVGDTALQGVVCNCRSFLPDFLAATMAQCDDGEGGGNERVVLLHEWARRVAKTPVGVLVLDDGRS